MIENGTLEPIEMLRIINGYANSSPSIDHLSALYEILSPHTPLIKEKEYKDINTRILSIIGGKKERLRSATDDVNGYIQDITGEMSVSRMFADLNLVSKEEKDLGRHAIRAAVRKGSLIATGKKTGIYRKIEQDENIIDWQNAVDDEYEIRWPLNLHELVKMYPGNIAVIAGASNVGKTSFLLEVIRLNQFKRNIIYFNSEMAASELRLRLLQFAEVAPLDRWKFKAVERSQNFADVIDPDAMNVIDFMEVYDEFWKIGAWIRDIHQKLKTGIAVIAIQKKADTKAVANDYGRGGELTLEKPRLYLAMDRGKIKIVKGKIWRRHDMNPNGLMRRFSLVGGWKFLPQTDWLTEDGAEAQEKQKKYKDYGVKDDDKEFVHED